MGEMKTYYVSFGGLLINYHQEFHALSENIVREWMRVQSKIGCWCTVYERIPGETLPLGRPIDLWYLHEDHIV